MKIIIFLLIFLGILFTMILAGATICGIYLAKQTIGTLTVDTTDSRKDLIRLNLEKDIPSFIREKYVVFKVDARFYPDQFKEEKK